MMRRDLEQFRFFDREKVEGNPVLFQPNRLDRAKADAVGACRARSDDVLDPETMGLRSRLAVSKQQVVAADDNLVEGGQTGCVGIS